MKARTIIDLLTLSSNLYLIAKDKQLMDDLSEFASKGKEKFDSFMEGTEDEDSQVRAIIHKVIDKAKEAKEELEEKVEEIAIEVYKKLHIAHTNEISLLNEKIAMLERRIESFETVNNSTQTGK
jgi:polyhydroxyalkanoate synthesis regulator phasin